MTESITTQQADNLKLFKEVSQLIEAAREHSLRYLNKTNVLLYWHIGHRINQDILDEKRAKYGENIIQDLALKLQTYYGRGFGRRVIERCIQFAKYFTEEKIVLSLAAHLKWTHFVTLLSLDDHLKREFYAEMCRIERWSTRQLNEKIEGMLYERTTLAKKPEVVIHSEIEKLRNTNELHADWIIQDPYVFENLFGQSLKTEKSLEDAIINDIEAFLLNMGNGFAFLERQKVIEVDGEHFKIDLLFFHRKLRRIIAIELKRGRFKPADKGQVELYLRWLEKYEMQPGENTPIGIILCSEKSEERVELLQLENSGIRVCQYLTELPPKEIFEARLHDAIQRARERYESQQIIKRIDTE